MPSCELILGSFRCVSLREWGRGDNVTILMPSVPRQLGFPAAFGCILEVV